LNQRHDSRLLYVALGSQLYVLLYGSSWLYWTYQ